MCGHSKTSFKYKRIVNRSLQIRLRYCHDVNCSGVFLECIYCCVEGAAGSFEKVLICDIGLSM